MSQFIDQAVSSVLSRSAIKLAHPGASMLHDLYATPASCTSTVAESVQSYHRVRVTSNNLQLASQSNFTISTSSIVSSMWLHVELAGTTGFKLPGDGWLFDAIGSIEITFSNSLLQNMVIPGSALRDYLLASCRDRTRRERLLKLAGQGSYNATAYASIPIGHILANASFQTGNYPIDFSVLSGPVLIQYNFNPGYRFTVKAVADFAPPTAWAACYMTAMTTDLTDSAFSVKTALSHNPQLIYTTPGKYINSVTYNLQSVSPGTEQTINLQSAPAGMLQAILLSIRPNGAAADGAAASSNWFGIAAGTALLHGSSVRLSSLSLAFGGQFLSDCRSYEEVIAMNMAAFEGDDLSYNVNYALAAGTNDVGQAAYQHNLYVIPFAYDMRKVLSEKHSDHVPGYSGSSLQLSFTVDHGVINKNATPFQNEADPKEIQNNLPYQVQVTYIIDALVQISGGTVDLQL